MEDSEEYLYDLNYESLIEELRKENKHATIDEFWLNYVEREVQTETFSQLPPGTVDSTEIFTVSRIDEFWMKYPDLQLENLLQLLSYSVDADHTLIIATILYFSPIKWIRY